MSHASFDVICVFRTPQCCVLLNTWCVSYTGSSRPSGATGMKAREKTQDPSAVKVHISHLYTVINKIIYKKKYIIIIIYIYIYIYIDFMPPKF